MIISVDPVVNMLYFSLSEGRTEFFKPLSNGEVKMTNQEYQEMYREVCFESGEKPSKKGFKNFVEWRKNVERLFDERDSK